MTVRVHAAGFRRLSAEALAEWSLVDAAGASDCLERAMAMDGGVQAVGTATRIVGQARTVRCMVGDNSALHVALNQIQTGDVIVADAGGFLGAAVWGGLMTHAAMRKGAKGLVIDGAVRDRAEIRDLGFPCFARGVVPGGPHKNFGGAIDAPISCGGVAVRPGDIVIGDEDGVAIVPFERAEETLAAFKSLKQREADVLAALDRGEALSDHYGSPKWEKA